MSDTVAPPAQGHNQRYEDFEIGSPERRDFFMSRVNPIARIEVEIEILKKKKKDAVGVAALDGIAKGDIAEFLKAAKIDDHKAAAEKMARKAEIYSWFNIVPVGFQASLFGEAEAPEIEKAANLGRTDCAMAKDKNSPYGAGTPQTRAYDTAYDEQHAKNLSKLGRGKVTDGGGGGAKKSSAADKAAQRAAAKADDKLGAAQSLKEDVKAGNSFLKEQAEKRASKQGANETDVGDAVEKSKAAKEARTGAGDAAAVH